MTSITFAAVIWKGRWELFSKYCTGSRIVFHNVSSKHNTSFVLLELWFQLRILQMTDVHEWSKVDTVFLLICASFMTSLLTFDFLKLPRWNRLELFAFFVHCCLCIQNFHHMRHRNECVHQVVMQHWILPFPCKLTFMYFLRDRFHSRSCGFMTFHNAIEFLFLESYCFHEGWRSGFPWACSTRPFLAGHGSRHMSFCNFLLAFMMMSLYSGIVGIVSVSRLPILVLFFERLSRAWTTLHFTHDLVE